jgi:hypothetical protein
VKGKKVYLVKASGGVYSDGPMAPYNFQDTYLRRFLAFLGMSDIEVIAIEGTAFGPHAAEWEFSRAAPHVASIPPYRLAAHPEEPVVRVVTFLLFSGSHEGVLALQNY